MEALIRARWSALLTHTQIETLRALTAIIGTAHEQMPYPTHNGQRLQVAGGAELPEYDAYLRVKGVAQSMNDVWNSIANALGERPTWLESDP